MDTKEQLKIVLNLTRQEALGISLKKIANIMKEVFDKAEINALIKDLLK